SYTDYRVLLGSGDVDALIVALPESAQVRPAIEAAAAGMHLLLEKPVASSPTDADTLAAGLDGTVGVHASGHLLRADPRYRAAATAVAQPDFAPIVHISAVRRSKASTAQRVAGRTSLLYYLGVHDFDAVAWLAGSPIRTVQALSRRPTGWTLDVDASMLVLAECVNGAIAHVELSWAVDDGRPRGLETQMTVVGSGGTVTIGGGDEVVISNNVGQRAVDALHWPELGGRVVGTLRYQVEQWIDAVEGKGQVAATIDDGLAAARVAFAVEQALATGSVAGVAA
ncbi:MAG: Gfo/Idh/MocA family protein, partial [Nocardioidaceae bacterium]